MLRPSAGATGLALLLRESGRLRLDYHAGYEPEVVERLRGVPLEHPYPATEVARTGRARYVASAAEFRSAQQGTADPIPAGGRQAWAFLPLAVAGEVLGALVVGYDEPRTFDPDERATLAALAGLSAQAMQRALLFEARTSMAATLQRALLPATLPATPGLRHAARYLPWTHGVEVGGDWYDIIALDDDVVGVVIGDVAGHNAAAAAAMGQVRNALRAYAIERHGPSAAMGHVNRLLWKLRLQTMVTCCYLELHLDEGSGTAVLAGHPPPMLRTAGGAHPLRLRPGVPLGVGRDATYLDTTFVVMPGDSLLLYTDGLVEDRRHPIDRGFQELMTSLQHAPTRDPDAILDHILASKVGPAPRTDDVAMICLTNDVPTPAARTARRSFRDPATGVAAAHRFVADILTAWDRQPSIDDARRCIDDTMADLLHRTAGDVTVHVSLDDAVRVQVTGVGTGPSPQR